MGTRCAGLARRCSSVRTGKSGAYLCTCLSFLELAPMGMALWPWPCLCIVVSLGTQAPEAEIWHSMETLI